MIIVKTLLLKNTEEDIKTAAELLKNGGVVGIPTETVYGLAADALNPEAVKKIFKAKGRPGDNPLIVHICDFSDIERLNLVMKIPDTAKKLADAFWPGPLTMIMKKSDVIPNEVSAGLDTVAIRFPSHKTAQAIIRESGTVLAAPSANISGSPSPTTAQHVMNDMDGKIDAVLDGGASEVGLESTVITLAGAVPRVLRPGGITVEMLESVLGNVEVDDAVLHRLADNVKVASPGMKYKHYAPKADMVIVDGTRKHVIAKINELVASHRDDGKKIAVIATEETKQFYDADVVLSMGSRADEDSIAHELYRILRDCDELDVDVIFSESFSTPRIGQAIMNRMLKAAGHQVIDTHVKYDKIIFVAQTGTCREQMAKGIMNDFVLKVPMEIEARGLVVQFPEPVNQKAEAILASHGLTMKDHTAKMLEQEDFDERTLILVMEDALKQRIFQEHENVQNTWQLSEYIKEETDVTEPVGGSLADYGACYELLDCMISSLVVVLNEEELLC